MVATFASALTPLEDVPLMEWRWAIAVVWAFAFVAKQAAMETTAWFPVPGCERLAGREFSRLPVQKNWNVPPHHSLLVKVFLEVCLHPLRSA